MKRTKQEHIDNCAVKIGNTCTHFYEENERDAMRTIILRYLSRNQMNSEINRINGILTKEN